MKDPCEECLVKVNCTQVCPEKENYKTLLKSAVRHFKKDVIYNVSALKELEKKHFLKYDKMLRETQVDISTIQSRRRKLNY